MKRQLLLINPPQNHTISSNLPKYVGESRGNIPPLGLLYTAAAVEQRSDWEVSLCDMSAGQQFNSKCPDLIGITATTFTLIDVLEVAKWVKGRWKDVPVVLGGIHPTIYPKETVNLPNIDCVFVGESETTFPEMIDYIAMKSVTVVTGKSPIITQLPFPAYHLLEKKRYFSLIGKSGYLTSMFTSRGCPYSCIFCHRETMGKKFRARTAQQVVDEIKQVTSMGIHEVLFYDDTFTIDKQRVIDICEGILKEQKARNIPNNFCFDIRARVDHTDNFLLHYLKQAGCKRIHYGVEASNDRVLKVLQKGITIEEAKQTFKATKEANIETLAYFIIGSPTETKEDILATIRLSRELSSDYCHFGIMTPYPATPLYQSLLDKGIPDYWKEFATNPRVDWTAPFWNEIPREELLKLLDRAYDEFYIRPSQIIKEAIKTKSFRQLVKKGSSAWKIFTRRSNGKS